MTLTQKQLEAAARKYCELLGIEYAKAKIELELAGQNFIQRAIEHGRKVEE